MSDLLSTTDLAKRWDMNPDVLARWRSRCIGPAFLRIGPRIIRYEMECVLAYEAENKTDSDS